MATAVQARESAAAPGAPRRGLRRLISQQVVPRLVLIGVCVIFVVPFYWMVVTAMKDTRELSQFPPALLPAAWDVGNFIRAMEFMDFPKLFSNSVIITVGVTIGAVISNTVVAYGFSRIRWPGRDIIFYIVIATVFIPFPVIMVALFDIFAKLGWVNTFNPIIVPAFFGNPFYIFLLRQFMLSIPSELSDAARVDGANEFQIFYRVVLPLTKPAVTVVAIFAAITAWNEFLLPLIYLQDEEKYPLSIGLALFRQTHDVTFNLLMAASTLVVIPVVILFLAFQRFFIEGITVGGVKG
jgi:multiple sugar transport system permease protein